MLVPFGRFGRPHGVRGQLRFWPYNPASPLLTADREIAVGSDAASTRTYRLNEVRFDARSALVLLDGVGDRDLAGELNGLTWFEEREAFGVLDDDEIYVADLVGLRAVTEDGREVGRVVDVQQVGETDLIVVKAGRREHLVPNVVDFVVRMDTQAGEIVIRPIEGLLEGWKGEASSAS